MKTIQYVLRSKGERKIPAKMGMCMSMVNRLPSEIIIEILSRLPTDSVLECRQVCKTWRNLIRHPSFAHMHLHQNVNILPFHSSATDAKVDFGLIFELRILSPKIEYILYYGEYDDQPNKKLRRINQPSINCLSIVGSHNGLICFSVCDSDYVSYIHEPIYISNPITREYMRFPRIEVNGVNRVHTMVCGFCYLPSTDKYKIIKIYYILNQPMGMVQMYTLGGGSCSGWRDIGEITYSLRHYVEYSFPRHPCPFGAFANGALHWLDIEQKIVSFDLAEEKFYLLPSPPFVSAHSEKNRFDLRVLGGCLCFIHRKQDKSLDIWFLRKKGESSSCDLNEQECDLLTWNMELSLPIDAAPISITKSGEFMMWYKSNLCSYDPKTATMEKHVLNGDFCHAVPHINSFVSLKALGEKCRSRKRYAVNASPTEYFITQERKDNGEFDVIQF
ncbi:F-box protein At3g07870-like [Papaver somniferum]|uniref:F-box protein At3g07870-like n=1 Tax=Papaver somniferum TaxID=3469 RepID=UPI000E6FA50E|nr:F-box protein At3g07870-like [Papaver somniferum]